MSTQESGSEAPEVGLPLDEANRPKTRVVVGVDVLLENCIAHLEKNNFYLASQASP